MVKYKRNYVRRSSKKAVTKTARKVVKASRMLMLKSVETKHSLFNSSFVTNSNQVQSWSPTQQIQVGNTAQTRVGDSVLLQQLILSGEFILNASALNNKYRIIVGYTRVQNAMTSVSSVSLSSTDLWYPIGGFFIHQIINPAVFTVLYDEMFDINSNTTTGRDIKSFYTVVNLGMKKFDYAPDGGSLGKLKNLVVAVVSLNPAAASGDAIGSIQCSTVLKYKDP